MGFSTKKKKVHSIQFNYIIGEVKNAHRKPEVGEHTVYESTHTHKHTTNKIIAIIL